jgi:hypothetical protein
MLRSTILFRDVSFYMSMGCIPVLLVFLGKLFLLLLLLLLLMMIIIKFSCNDAVSF